MKELTDITTLQITDPLTLKIFNESALFYDIETTGFSAKYNKIYFIGVAYRTGMELTVKQFFSETIEDEADILQAFLNLCGQFKSTITFNGLGFDLPFIRERCKKFNLSEHLDVMDHTDIFRLISPYRKIFQFPSMKQKSIEQFLGLHREDIYSGGELIHVYQEYLKDHNEQKFRLLQLHNREDVLGMADILPILSYVAFFQGNFTLEQMLLQTYRDYEGTDAFEMIFTLHLQYALPKQISCSKDDMYFSGFENTIRFRTKIHQGELKYFYPDYKDYFYLPQEDMAIHKSVAAYVDKEFREKAKPATCYSRKNSLFLPQYEEIITPAFKTDYQDKISYFELTKEFENHKELQKKYILHLLSHICRMKNA